MRIVSIVGARPQYIKLAPLHRQFERLNVEHLVINTGQHYDFNLSGVFFGQLDLPKPKYDLGVGSGSASEMVARILESSARALRKLRPDVVVVYGDTNSTLGGALAAVQLHVPLAHVEAGLRCFDLSVAEELNRVVTDRVSTYLFCPTPHSRENLRREGIRRRVCLSGDILYDVARLAKPTATETKAVLKQYDLTPEQYLFLTCHRAETVDDEHELSGFVKMISTIREPVIFPVHPRTKKNLKHFGLNSRLTRRKNLRMVDPCSYRESLALIGSARMVLTDSGGVQREAYYLKVPTLLLREVTEWVEILKSGGSMIVGMSRGKLRYGLTRKRFRFDNRTACRTGASARIASMLSRLS